MRRATIFFLTITFMVFSDVSAYEKVRLSVAAGPLYPLEAETLRSIVNKFCEAAQVPDRQQRLLACVVPHGGYGLSGDIVGHAFKSLEPGQYSRVIVLAPSHFAEFELCSIVAARVYVTPLGFVLIDQVAVNKLNFSPLFSVRGLRYKPSTYLSKSQYVKLHEVEHSIEAVLPFLQERLGNFLLVPILVGTLSEATGDINRDRRLRMDRVESIAATIKKVVDERTLIVVSTDFTHYGKNYQYAPSSFEGREKESIERLDREAYDLVIARDSTGFEEYLARTGNRICGRNALRVFMKLLPQTAQGEVLATTLSADKTQDFRQSVSYAAINFYDPAKRPLQPPLQQPIFPVNEALTTQTQVP